MIITVDVLKAIAPGSKKTKYKLLPDLAHWMNEFFPKFYIDTPSELRHIIAQLAHESDSFNTLEEYASGKAYEGRKGLGNIYAGDGIKFKGRGPLQNTGRTQYKLLSVKSGSPSRFIDNPKLLSTPEWGVWAACIYWTENGLLAISNMDDSAKVPYKRRFDDGHVEIIQVSPVEYISRRVNGGVNGLQERIKFYERAKSIIA